MKSRLWLRGIGQFVALLLFSVPSCWAQNYVATQPDNALTPADPIGTTPMPSSAGTSEAVNNTNGGLSFFLPVLSLPQRGGWNLTLGYYNTSPQWSVRQDVAVTVTNPNGGIQGGSPAATSLTYNDNYKQYPQGLPLKINLPTLQASIEYTGDADVYESAVDEIETPVLCLTNWVFTDWSGNKHPFTNVTFCSAGSGGGGALGLAQVTDSSDGSWLRLDTSNYTSQIIVRTKDGAVYTFPGIPVAGDPFSSCRNPTCFNNTTANTANYSNPFYYQTFSNLVDSTGNNTVTWNGSTLTDTIGRAISIANSGITYRDSNGNNQTITIAGASQAQQTYNLGSFNCSKEKDVPNSTVTVRTGPSSFTLNPSTYTITLPGGRVYELQFDGLSNLNQITYPQGGYTKYVFPAPATSGFYQVQGVVGCLEPEQEISQKRDCPLSSSSCSGSQELVTTYTPAANAAAPFNDSMAIQDALGDVTKVVNQNMGASAGFVAPHEVTRYVYPPGQYPSGTPLRTIQTAYTPYVGGVDVQVPSQVTTTLDDISPSLSAVKNYQYQTVQMSFHCVSSCSDGAQVAIDNATEIDEYDYGNTTTPLKKTAQTWMTASNGAIYDIAQGHLLDRLASRTVTDPASGIQETLSYSYNSVGDITSKTVGGTSVSSLTTNYQRDSYGNITQQTDAKNNITKFGYTNNWADSGCSSLNPSAYLTSITDALNHVTTLSYFSCTGLKASLTDPNNQPTTYTYDALGRPLVTTRADTGETTDSYVDSIPNSITESSSITSGVDKVQKTILDGFGRTLQTQLTDPEGTDYVDTTYDSLGRVASVSNPYRSTSDPTYGITSYSYDPLNRTKQVTEPDGSAVLTTYAGNTATVQDEAGKQRKRQTDALGRLTNVWEDPGGLNYATAYSYDAFDNLTSAVQNGSRQRTFSYNAFSQLVSATNPESNQISYTYDKDGNLATKADARSITNTYSYDALNRLTGITYSDGDPSVGYTYDQSGCLSQPACYNVGRRTTMTDAGGAEYFAYDKMGRVIADQRTTNGVSQSTVYAYDLAGDLTTLIYPSGRTVNYTSDSDGRPSIAQDAQSGTFYAKGPCTNGMSGNGACHAPQGAISQMQTGANLIATYLYNVRLQPCWIYATTGTPLPTNTSCTASDPGPGNILDLQYNFNLGHDNGNVVAITNNRNSLRTQTFAYDALNRLASGQSSATYSSSSSLCWGESYSYDQWANLYGNNTLSSSYTGCTQTPGFTLSPTANNQFAGYSYDAAGNILNDGNAYAWNAENQIKSAAGVSYTYDGDGNRLMKSSGKIYWYGPSGEILAESDASGHITDEYVFFAGKRLAHIPY